VIRVEEIHNSLLFAAVLAVPGLVMLAVAVSHSTLGLRIGLGVGGVVMLGAALMAWSGFHYVFTDAGLEVSTLGYRLRSIAPDAIREYYPAQWSVAGGYGIRGLGASRAYVWGNKGARIKLDDGKIFLGSSNPQELIRNLDQLTHRAHS
jgi:hypothetical protein